MKNEKPLVSVITPVYNGEKYLQETIESVLAQTYINWELVIINDLSVDNSKEIIFSYSDKRIRYFENESNMGIVGARNRAVELARGEYCAILDHDDIALPKRFEKQVRFLNGHPDYGLCGAWAESVDGNVDYIYPAGNEMLQCALLFHFPFIHSAIMFRTNILRSTKYRKEFETAEDYDLVSRIAEHGKMATMKETLALFRIHENNASSVRSVSNTAARENVRIRQLQHLGITPSRRELKLQIYTAHLKIQEESLPADFLVQLQSFFKKIINANRKVAYYNQTSFKAYLLFRWIMACLFLNRRTGILRFWRLFFNPITIIKLSALFWGKLYAKIVKVQTGRRYEDLRHP